jgi:sugar (pentulose or hexulose) kinase
VWVLTKEVLREAAARSGPTELRALSVSVQATSFRGSKFNALHPAILGMDYRAAHQAARCEERFGAFELFQRTGMRHIR